MANDSFHRKTSPSLLATVMRASGTATSGRLLSRLMTLAGVLVVLVYWRQTGGW